MGTTSTMRYRQNLATSDLNGPPEISLGSWLTTAGRRRRHGGAGLPSMPHSTPASISSTNREMSTRGGAAREPSLGDGPSRRSSPPTRMCSRRKLYFPMDDTGTNQGPRQAQITEADRRLFLRPGLQDRPCSEPLTSGHRYDAADFRSRRRWKALKRGRGRAARHATSAFSEWTAPQIQGVRSDLSPATMAGAKFVSSQPQ